MKLLLIVMAFVLVSFCGALQASANPMATCYCWGKKGAETSGCGNGAPTAAQGAYASVTTSGIGEYLKDSTALLHFSQGYYTLDLNTGWYCIDKATWK
jgi:hypothetical protein